jgi:hypothetical protein
MLYPPSFIASPVPDVLPTDVHLDDGSGSGNFFDDGGDGNDDWREEGGEDRTPNRVGKKLVYGLFFTQCVLYSGVVWYFDLISEDTVFMSVRRGIYDLLGIGQ